MAELSDAHFYSTIWGKMPSFYNKEKREMIVEKNEQLAMLLKDKTGHFQGISCFLGAMLAILLEPCIAHCPLGLDGASETRQEDMGRQRAWHSQQEWSYSLSPSCRGGKSLKQRHCVEWPFTADKPSDWFCLLISLRRRRALGWKDFVSAPPSQAGCVSLDLSLHLSEPGFTHL